MNVASVFGGGAAEVEETTEIDEEEQAEEATHLDSSLEAPDARAANHGLQLQAILRTCLSRIAECRRAA